MSVTRRTFVRRSGLAGFGLFFAGLFPEVAAATPSKPLPLTTAQRRAVSLVQHDKRTATVLSRYSGYRFGWTDAVATLDGSVGRVDVTGTSGTGSKGAVIASVFVNTSTSKILFVEHAHITSEPEGGTHSAKLQISFDDADPVWRGGFTQSGDLVPEHSYPDLKTLRTMKQPASCKSLVGKVCDYASAGDSILACAVLAETGPGAVACGFALLIISIYGCGKLKRMICD